ncbi:MAG TPA: aminomethyl-transferring glycine dehydrogenase subunit GcvPA [Gammaproteobacteria bacterium]|nr:aminomethyl-transferring glycine dehydrogenase subunit GcvPA [Gammaproteobacteria bacterium]
MPFIPHTEEETQHMLAEIGINNIEALFSEIPTLLKSHSITNIPEGLTEIELFAHVEQELSQDSVALNFAGAGSYEHHIPACVWDLVSRGEFLTAYTPYQAEVSQGTLQCLWEYQTMMASLMGHPVSNASLYDGASALAEAILMGLRVKKAEHPVIFMPDTVHPFYRHTVQALLEFHSVEMVSIPYNCQEGHISLQALEEAYEKTKACTLCIIPQPNFFGILEDASSITDWAHEKNALVIGVVNPTAMAWLKPPGQWGTKGADIACGEGQPLGVPLNRGGPYFGFLTCQSQFIRQLPGRLVGETVDAQNNRAFTLTLQAREQHIRRAKATSNICTNQGLLVTAATIYMSLLGPYGLKKVAQVSHHQSQKLCRSLQALNGFQVIFNRPFFHEITIRCPVSAPILIERMLEQNILAGISLEETYPELDNALLISVTETKTDLHLQQYLDALKVAVR